MRDFIPYSKEQYRALNFKLFFISNTEPGQISSLVRMSKAILNNIKKGSPFRIQGIHTK